MTRGRLILVLATLVVLLAFFLGRTTLYTVNERELAVILEFGKPVASRTEPGLYVKWPLIQEVHKLPKTLQFWSGASGETLVDLPTADGKKIEVDVWAVWRITDPVQFVEVLRNVENGEARVKQYVRAVARDKITSYSLAEVVRSSDRKLTFSLQMADLLESAEGAAEGVPVTEELREQIAPGSSERIRHGRKKIVDEIKAEVQERLADKETARGIVLVDLGLSRIDFVPAVREAAFNRQIELMQSIAALYTSDGELRKQEILNRTNAEVKKIEGEGQQEANVLRGDVDAEITEVYAKAIEEAGDFYFFYRTLETYTAALSGRTRLVLTTDSDLFRLLKDLESPSSVAGEADEETAGGSQ